MSGQGRAATPPPPPNWKRNRSPTNAFETEQQVIIQAINHALTSRYLPPSKVDGCEIDNSMVSEGCILNGVTARNSIIGLRSRIDKGVVIEDSIIMGSDIFETISELQANLDRKVPHVGIDENTVIRKAIIDKNVRIGKNVQLINRNNAQHFDSPDRSYYIRDGIIIVPKNALIPDGTII